MFWDPSGRYLASCLMKDEKQRISDEASFRIFTMVGDLVFLKRLPSLTKFQWRARPHKLLTGEEMVGLEKQMPEITKRLQASYKQQREDKLEGRK